MTFRKRLAVFEKSIHRLNYVPPIVIHTIVEPSEDGPKEVEAFAQMQTNGICQRIERKADETQRPFENRIQSQLQFWKEAQFEKVSIMQHEREDVAIRHVVAFCAIALTAKKITAGRKITARGKSVWRKNES